MTGQRLDDSAEVALVGKAQIGGQARQIALAAFGALVITGARLGKILGHRRAFIRGLLAFTLASLLAGLAPSPAVLIAPARSRARPLR